jgi:hypothetical protein
MVLLNDVQADHRLAYLLGPTLARYSGRKRARKVPTLALLGAGTLVLVLLWEWLQRH